MKELGYGEGYAYDHDAEGRSPARTTFPTTWSARAFYQPKGAGREAPIREKLEQWAKLRRERSGD